MQSKLRWMTPTQEKQYNEQKPNSRNRSYCGYRKFHAHFSVTNECSDLGDNVYQT